MQQQAIGVIGWLKYFHSEHGRTVAACDLSERKLDSFTAQHPDVARFTDYKALADAGILDAVVISTPNWVHTEMAEYFMARGIHVFLEKPMGINRAEIDALVRAQRASGKICAIDFELRVSPGFLRLRELIAAGEIGDPVGIEFIHHRGAWLASGAGVWRTDPQRSGGLFFMEICHEVDIFRALFGEITHTQSFSMPTVLPQYQGMPDNVVSHFWFAGGQRGVILAAHTSSVFNAAIPHYDETGHDMYFVIIGTEGAIRMECIKERLLVCRYADYHPDAPVGKRVEFSRIEEYGPLGHFAHDIEANYRAFLKSCATGAPFHQSTEDAWRSHVVCLAAEHSALHDNEKIAIDYTLADGGA